MLFVYLILIIGPIANFWHELGHTVAALLLKTDRVELTLGKGKAFTHFKINTVHITIQNIYFLGGVTNSRRAKAFNHQEKILLALAGPIFSLLLTILSFIGYLYFMHNILLMSMIYNGWIAFMNLVPFKLKNKKSDGYIAWQAFVQRKNTYKK